MFKKILVVMGVSISFLGLIACGHNYTAFELFEHAQEVLEDFDSMTIDLDVMTEVTAEGLSETEEMSLRMNIEMLSDVEFNMSAAGSTMGIDVNLYFRDGYMYTEVMGHHSKEEMDFEDALEMTGGNLVESTLEEDWIEESSVESMEDGGYRLDFTVDSVKMLDESFGDSIAGIPFSEDMIDDGTVEMTFYLDENYYFTHAEIEMDITLTILGEAMDLFVSVDATYVQLGNVSVEFPEWVDEFFVTIEDGVVDLQAYLDMVRAGGESALGDVGVGDTYMNMEVGEGNEFIFTLEETAEYYEDLEQALDVDEGIGFLFVAMANDYRTAFSVDQFRFTYRVVDVETGEELGRFYFDSE